MGHAELSTAKYFEQVEQERAAAAAKAAEEAAAAAAAAPPPKADPWGQVYCWGSYAIGAAALVCVVALALPMLSPSGKRSNAIDWMLWLGGAKPDQTFEKFLLDTAATNQREWEDRYRESPAYQLQSMQFDASQLNLNQGNWQPQPSPRPRGK